VRERVPQPKIWTSNPVPSRLPDRESVVHLFVTKSENVETDLALPAAKRAAGFGFAPKTVTDANPDYPLDNPGVVLAGRMLRKDGSTASVTLVPMGAKNAQLRRVTFQIAK
jgi:hypothetical protein